MDAFRFHRHASTKVPRRTTLKEIKQRLQAHVREANVCLEPEIKEISLLAIVNVFKQRTKSGATEYRVAARIAQFGKGVNQRTYP